jgi:5''-nucleotidase/2'',3''-cyclic phosphodiesterase and related esterases
MKKFWKVLIAALALLSVFTLAIAETSGLLPEEKSGVKRILVIETTDIHGYIMDASSGKEETFQYRLAYIAHLINEARASGEYDDVLLLDGGDLYQGTPVSNLTGGAAIRAALDVMNYDAIALGNHEFDWDVTEYAADQDGTIAPYILGDYFGDEKTPILASNLYDASTGERVPFTQDYAIVEKAGLRIAIVGYITDYRKSIMSEKIEPYTIDPDMDKLDALTRRIRDEEDPDALIILAHAAPVDLAEAADPSIVDLVAGGHTHKIAADRADNEIPYIQGYYYGNGFASAVLVINSDGEVTVEDVQYTSITDDKELLYATEENIEHLDPEIMEISYATWTAVQEEMSEVLGYTDTPILKVKEIGACSAGNWITGLMLRATQENGAIMAFYNIGGIRTSLEIPEGQTTREIKVYDMYTITPFANSLLLYDITGQELAKLLQQGLNQPNYGDQMTGLTFTYTATGDSDTPREEREFTIKSITLDDGKEVDINDTETLYRICTSNYNATMPDSIFEGKEPVFPLADAPIDNDEFIRLLRVEKEANGGYITVDTGLRGIHITE